MKPWYESLFENHAKRYDQESFTQGTVGECNFVEKEINCNRAIESWISAAERGGIPSSLRNVATRLLGWICRNRNCCGRKKKR